jgi:hypothetical protein
MKLNKNLNLILKDVYVYDIKSCHYEIMKNLGFNLDNIDSKNKLERNIKIGIMMKQNPKITSILRNTTKAIIDNYIIENNIKEDNIIIRQYDGLILTKQLHNTNIGFIPLTKRKTFQSFIMSFNRNKYIALTNNLEIVVKGISYKYKEMNNIYKKLCQIINLTKDRIFHNLQLIKNEIYNTNNYKLFGIPIKDNKMIIYLKGYGEIEITSSTLKVMDINDIDRKKYFDFYIKPFTQSIVYENLKFNIN